MHWVPFPLPSPPCCTTPEVETIINDHLFSDYEGVSRKRHYSRTVIGYNKKTYEIYFLTFFHQN